MVPRLLVVEQVSLCGYSGSFLVSQASLYGEAPGKTLTMVAEKDTEPWETSYTLQAPVTSLLKRLLPQTKIELNASNVSFPRISVKQLTYGA